MSRFLESENEKLNLWWAGVSKREMASYAAGAAVLLFLVFLYYFAMGITGLFSWYRFQRSMCECFLLLFLTQLMTRKNLLHPFWRIGYIPFFAWITIFPYVMIHAVNGIESPEFNKISPYFLTAIGIELLIFFIMNVITRVVIGKKLATLICLAAVWFFSFSAFIFLVHYEFMGLMMTAKEMAFVMADANTWLSEVVLTHISPSVFMALNIGAFLYLVVYAKWIYQSAYHLDRKWVKDDLKTYSTIHRILQFLVFLGCAWLLIRWCSECFPLHDIEDAKRYEPYIDFIQNTWL